VSNVVNRAGVRLLRPYAFALSFFWGAFFFLAQKSFLPNLFFVFDLFFGATPPCQHNFYNFAPLRL